MSTNSLAGRLKSRFARRSRQGERQDSEEAFTELLPSDKEECAEITELLLVDSEVAGMADQQQQQQQQQQQRSESEQIKELQAQLMDLAVENEALRERANQIEAALASANQSEERVRQQLANERQMRQQQQQQETGESSPGRFPLALARLRRRRAVGIVGDSSKLSEPPPDDADLESLASEDSCADADDAAAEPAPTRSERLRNWLAGRFLDFVDDLQPERSSSRTNSATTATVEEALSARRLKANFTRFGRGTRPIGAMATGLQRIARWHSPACTCLAMALYYSAILFNMVLPAILLLCIVRLCLNYLKYRLKWRVEFNFVAPYDANSAEQSSEKTVGTQVNFVVHVAKKVQNLTGNLSDNLEKFKNLITWQCPEYTKSLLQILLLAFAVSLAVPTATILHYGLLYLGVKLFFVDALFAKYPRLKRKYDTLARVWRSLPTDQALTGQQVSADVEKYLLPRSSADSDQPIAGEFSSTVADSQPIGTDEEIQFFQAFSLPSSERPLPKWKGGKRCAIVCKEADKALPNSLKHGRLFLTRSFLCFERSKDRNKQRRRNIVLPLTMIRRAKKTKLFSFLPGGGMAIEITVCGVEKPITFGAIIGRDEAFDSLMSAGSKADLPWCGGSQQQTPDLQEFRPDPELAASIAQALLSDSEGED